MKIYWFKAQAPRRVLALVKHLGIAAELIPMRSFEGGLNNPEYAQLNPNRKAPTLVDGETVLWESSAIMAYLCVKAGSDMWPSTNPAEQVELLRWLSWSESHWGPAVSPFYFEKIIKAQFNLGAPNQAELDKAAPNVARFGKILDLHLQDRQFVACDRLTIADFHLASMAAYWQDATMPLNDFTAILRWLDRLAQIPAWADPWP
jgi:glutathione S-transferase